MKRYKVTAEGFNGVRNEFWIRANDICHAAYFVWSELSGHVDACVSIFIEEVS